VSLLYPQNRGAFGIVRSVHVSVPWRSCLGYRQAGCLQLSRRRPAEMCILWTHLWTDTDRVIFVTVELPSAGGEHIVLPPPGRYLVKFLLYLIFSCVTIVKVNERLINTRSVHMYCMCFLQSTSSFMQHGQQQSAAVSDVDRSSAVRVLGLYHSPYDYYDYSCNCSKKI